MSYGVKLHSEKKPIKAAPQRPKQAGNNWIYDTINKYFDVIVEDDESEESESCSSEEESSDLEIEDFETIISSRNNYALQKTKSSAKLRSMVSSLMVEKSISVDSMGTFKNNLNSYLQKSKSVVS
ncbi:Hypothetical protein FKW44_012923 [Caligus rogercresseyi]|uniref:Uncharacterized protein n=1 Tax=Caligus rogercresseyi TaxID=217165 RepID=A0A7T8HKC4_CALRO|nr:Hypothetical protein FKW44_012923 [Caligus rogercresseyi]